jgi:uncharacterized protein involved in response to NO
LFPIGLGHALQGAALWVLFVLGWLEAYPLRAHAHVMIGGFLLSFALGFLLTAAPRFTQTAPVTRRELMPVVALMASTLVTAHLTQEGVFFATLTAALLLTVATLRRRFQGRRVDLPPGFLFVGVAMLGGVVATALLAVGATTSVGALPEPVATGARSFFLRGMPLLLVIGIGSKLFPALTGAGDAAVEPTAPSSAEEQRSQARFRKARVPLLLGLAASLGADAAGEVRLSVTILAVVMAALAPLAFRLHRLPRGPSWIGRGVWAGAWLFCLSPLPVWLYPALATHLWHWLFIGGFGLLTAMVSLRVAAAHGGGVLATEVRRRILPLITGLILLAAATRVSAIFIPKVLLSHYAYAGAAWMLAYVLWAFVFVRMHRAADGAAQRTD